MTRRVEQVVADQPYVVGGGEPDQLLDVYVPADRPGPYPLVVWSGGSAFAHCDGKRTASLVADGLVPFGFSVAGVSVRSAEQAPPPLQVCDAVAAIGWLTRHAAELHIDRRYVVPMGDSSGGWVTLMTAIAAAGGIPAALCGAHTPIEPVAAAVAFFPPTRLQRLDVFRPEVNPLSTANATDCVVRLSSVRSALAPVLLVHGNDDDRVRPQMSARFYTAAADIDLDVTRVLVDGVGHELDFLSRPSPPGAWTVASTHPNRDDVDLLRRTGPSWRTIAAFVRSAIDRSSAPPTPPRT